MRCKFLAPESLELLPQILILLGNCCIDGTDNCSELLVSQLCHASSHLSHVHIKARSHVQAVLGRRLDQEPGADDVTGGARPREDDITELLFCSQLVECGLLQVLKCQLVEQVKFSTILRSFTSILIVRKQARVLISWLWHREVDSMEVARVPAKVDDTHIVELLFRDGREVGKLDGLVNDLLRLVLCKVAVRVPKHSALLEPVCLHCLESIIVEGVEDLVQGRLLDIIRVDEGV